MSLLTAAAFTGCWELPPGDKTSVYYWSDLFLEKYADELVVGELEPGPARLEEPRTVLLITGVTIRAEWFDPIVARLTRDGFRPVVYEPPELLSGDLFQASEDLAAVVERVKAESGQDKIDILAECTGGVIARHYIQSLGGDEHVARMVTFVSPQHGVDKAPWAALIAGWPALDDLSPGSAFLEAVNNAPLPAGVPFTSIYTCTDEYIQPFATSIIPGAKNIGLCDGFVAHFQTFYDPAIYLIMHEALLEPTPAELAAADDGEPDDGEPGDAQPDDEPDDSADDASEDALDGPPAAAGDDQPEGAQPPADDGGLEPVAQRPAQSLTDPAELGGLGCGAGGGSGAGLLFGALALGGLFGWRRRLTSAAKCTNESA